ncbi:MAG: hypothetical protein KAG94_01155 [Clostridiales bacterium]|nr:hypothetical protein [Clostridiales bacterium]
MEKVFLIIANDKLEAFLIESILKKNKIDSNIQIIPKEDKRKFNQESEKVNIFVNKGDYEQAVKLMDVIANERLEKEEKKEETRLFTRKQLFFAVLTTSIFLIMVIWIVIYAMK